MGCFASKARGRGDSYSASNTPTRRVSTSHGSSKSNGGRGGPLSEKEIQMRIEAPAESQVFTVGGITFRYAWVSQRGYYPDSPDKENQDAFSVIPNFISGDSTFQDQAFFGVYDGHGKEGHLCARYIRDNLPPSILYRVDRLPEATSQKSVKQAITVAHFNTNDALHAERSIDDSLSGTTSISVLFRGKSMYVSNVGDSRAIVATMQSDGRIVAKPMSSDQTPYRKDERERVKKHGARILSMDQIEGLEPVHENWGDINLGEDIDEGGDPPRVWSPHGDFPGTAFTRSFGDQYAEELGVSAEAEIFVRDINRNDKYVFVASDGVFEFLTNQMVVDIAARTPDPLEACKAIVTSAYNMWLQYEVRTDDITIIALYVEDYNRRDSTDKLSSANSPVAANSQEMFADRPVRRALSREKRKTIIQVKDDDKDHPEDETDDESLRSPKSEDERNAIEEALKTNFLFQHLNHTQRQHIIDFMQPLNVSTGDWVIRQGDQGDRFYVIESGLFEVRVCQAGVYDPTGGTVVHIYVGGADQHPGFGELSLMYGKPRAASVIAISEGKLWALDRKVFRKVVMRSLDTRKGIIRTLRKVELLKCLNVQQMQRLADLLVEDSFPAKHTIIRQGEVGDNFYLIVKGKCDCTVNGNNSEDPTLVMQLKDHDYFGEKALLTSNPRAANVVTTTPTKILYINKAAFEEVLGPLSAIIDEDRRRREAAALLQLEHKGPKRLSDLHLCGVVSTDGVGPLLLGSFNTEDVKTPNVCIRSFVLSDVDRLNVVASVTTSIETARALLTSSVKVKFIPELMSILKDNNAFHLIYDVPVVCDLTTIIASANIRTTFGQHVNSSNNGVAPQQPLKQEVVTYLAACIISGLEVMHNNGIIYRAIQPDSVHVDSSGSVVLMDYRVSKVGLVGGKTYTICGAADYLSPEQISQRGHGTSVDLWSLGTLLFELSVGIHPFSCSSEVATYSKISSFGTKAFPSLKFPDYVSSEIKSLINQLLVPSPEARIGSGLGGFETLKKHSLFRAIDWKNLPSVKSPLQGLAATECEDICQEGLEDFGIDTFEQNYKSNSGWEKVIDLE